MFLSQSAAPPPAVSDGSAEAFPVGSQREKRSRDAGLEIGEGMARGDETARLVFIDSCAVNRFATMNIDPVKASAGSEFVIAMTPDLRAEYQRGLVHRFVEPHIKRLLRALLDGGRLVAPVADDGVSRGVDCELVALSRTEIVVTVDAKPPWDRARGNAGLVVWADLEPELRRGTPLVSILRGRAAMP